jgi:hypothetical protein
LPATKLSSGSTSVLDVVGIGLPTIVLAGSAGSGPQDCTKGAGPLKHCGNMGAGKDGNGLCDTDADCGQLPGTCLPDANCYFGPPVPVAGQVAACAVNALLSDMCGSLNVLTFEVNFSLAVQSRIYVSPDMSSPCPRCIDGVCTTGRREGLACTPVGPDQTSPDCLPGTNRFLGALDVVIPALTTGTATMLPDQGGIFCDGQVEPGALGFDDARSITQTGVGVASGGLSGETTAVATFCIPPSGHPVLDSLGGFPAAGTLSAKSSIDISQILLP